MMGWGNEVRLLRIGETGLSSRSSGGSLLKGNVCSWNVTSHGRFGNLEGKVGANEDWWNVEVQAGFVLDRPRGVQ